MVPRNVKSGRIIFDDFKYLDFKINEKTNEKYFQQYLAPSYYLEVFFYSIDEELLLKHFDYICDKISDQLVYHHNNTKNKETKMKNKIKSYNDFKDSIQSKDYVWSMFTGNAGAGNQKEVGGVSDASFCCWYHKKNQHDLENDIEDYKNKLNRNNAKVLPLGIKISLATVCLPIDAFENEDGFKNWVLESPLVKNGQFFSGTAGYRINYWPGYKNETAKNRLNEILLNFPGFDFEISIGNTMGRLLTEDKKNILPVVKRPNWLTLVSSFGVEILGGIEFLRSKTKMDQRIQITKLSEGICLQATNNPVLFHNDVDLDAYVFVSDILKPLRYLAHEKDFYFDPDNEIAKKWLYRFNQNA